MGIVDAGIVGVEGKSSDFGAKIFQTRETNITCAFRVGMTGTELKKFVVNGHSVPAQGYVVGKMKIEYPPGCREVIEACDGKDAVQMRSYSRPQGVDQMFLLNLPREICLDLKKRILIYLAEIFKKYLF